MKEDIGWAKKEIKELMTEESQNYPHDEMVEKEMVLGILNQLDEPEVLSQDWIDENSSYASFDGIAEEYIHVDDLKELLVPKQELPVIPSYVAEYLEFAKSDVSLMRVLEKASRRDEMLFLKWEKEYAWISTNDETFARAWLDGYTVAEEQKYYVLDSQDVPLLERANGQTYKTTTALSIYEDGRDNSRFELNEQEIKDYDERFWAFAVLKGECQ